jgi:ribosomal protein S18 acetylase RimI-like enzyme
MSQAISCLEVIQLSRVNVAALAVFFEVLRKSGDDAYFHPHPLTDDEARAHVGYRGADLYYGVTDASVVLAYGMLRGWDEGYKVPSLGIAVHPNFRGTGVADLLMRFLHLAALLKGSDQIRLTVDVNNVRAVRLYERLGYAFDRSSEGRLIGTLSIRQNA